MSELVKLPSGAIAPLDVPSLPAVLAAGGDVAVLAAASFAHDEVSPADLREDDTYFVASWALDTFAQTDAALDLAAVCDCWSRAPSAAVGLTDAALAWVLDRALAVRFIEAQNEAQGDSRPRGEDSETRIRFSVPEVVNG